MAAVGANDGDRARILAMVDLAQDTRDKKSTEILDYCSRRKAFLLPRAPRLWRA